jgi:hypothetical protein
MNPGKKLVQAPHFRPYTNDDPNDERQLKGDECPPPEIAFAAKGLEEFDDWHSGGKCEVEYATDPGPW